MSSHWNPGLLILLYPFIKTSLTEMMNSSITVREEFASSVIHVEKILDYLILTKLFFLASDFFRSPHRQHSRWLGACVKVLSPGVRCVAGTAQCPLWPWPQQHLGSTWGSPQAMLETVLLFLEGNSLATPQRASGSFSRAFSKPWDLWISGIFS